MTLWDTALQSAAWAWFARVLGFNFLNEAVRYLVAALLLWGVFHVALRRRLAHRLIAQWPTPRDVRREIACSLLSMVVFAAIGVGVFAMVQLGHMEIYFRPQKHAAWWWWASIPFMLVWHDAYFYWTHRLMHTRWLFRHVHAVHHRSRHPSPWAAYAFHPIEAFINGLMVPLPLLVLPLPAVALFVVGVHQVLRNAHGHLAVETMPHGFARHWLGGRFTTTTHHHMHHEKLQGNYGLWFSWWDRWCGTEFADYHARFDAATPPRPRPQRLEAQP